jgi:hypothetical protein
MTKLRFALIVGAVLASLPATAHVSYTNRDFGSFSGLSAESRTIANQAITGNYGWADAADADWGDSHKVRWYTFTLLSAADVTISASANASATGASVGGLLPGFSLYAGKAVAAAYDNSYLSWQYRKTLSPETLTPVWNPPSGSNMYGSLKTKGELTAGLPGYEGSLNTRGNVTMGNDAGATSMLSFIGYAVDGDRNNFSMGFEAGIVGDGVKDGFVTKTFQLGAGTYSVVIGGADYAQGLSPTDPQALKAYGIAATVAAVPEPETYALLLAGLGLMTTVARRRSRATS